MRRVPPLVLSCALGHLTAAGVAQCTTQWTGGLGIPGVDGAVSATLEWDRDSGGPLPPLWVVGGAFAVAGNVAASNVASLDPAAATWSTFGSGVDGTVRAFAPLGNGDLVAAGSFSSAGGAAAARIARWNGSAWSPLGSGLDGEVFALLRLPSGDLLAGGDFTTAGGSPAPGVARWDGATWHPLGASPRVRGLAHTPAGNVFAVGGDVAMTGGYVREWNGAAWVTHATPNGVVHAAHALPNGDVVFGGAFSIIGSVGTIFANGVAAWTGSAWLPFGSGISGTVHALLRRPNGELVAGGVFQSSGSTIVRYLARWDGTSWSQLGGAPGEHFNAAVPALANAANGDLLVGGSFSTAPGLATRRMARWDGTSWRKPPGGIDGLVFAVHPLPDGDVLVGGSFTELGGVLTNGLARWTPGGWTGYGSGPGTVYALAVLADGSIVAAVPTSPSFFACTIVRWSGTAWAPIGATDNAVNTMVVLPNGDLVVGGMFTQVSGIPAQRLARWNGTWSAVAGGASGSVLELLAAPNGDLVVGGGFVTAGGVAARALARFDGTQWHAYGAGLGGSFVFVSGLAWGPDGTLLVAGNFASAGGHASTGFGIWDGTGWSVPPLLQDGAGPGIAAAVVAVPGGDVIVSGTFTHAGGTPAERIARWDGTAWSAIGAGTSPTAQVLRFDARGELIVASGIEVAGGNPALGFVRLVSTCPARSVVSGSGCTGSGGANVLTTAALPWLGETFRGRATGMPPNGLALAVTGFAGIAVPLAAIVPQGVPGCSLLATPELVETVVPAAGSVETALAIPNVAALLGLVLHHQVVGAELTPGIGVTALTSTNALVLTTGVF